MALLRYKRQGKTANHKKTHFYKINHAKPHFRQKNDCAVLVLFKKYRITCFTSSVKFISIAKKVSVQACFPKTHLKSAILNNRSSLQNRNMMKCLTLFRELVRRAIKVVK
jgi:hypothetical protein